MATGDPIETKKPLSTEKTTQEGFRSWVAPLLPLTPGPSPKGRGERNSYAATRFKALFIDYTRFGSVSRKRQYRKGLRHNERLTATLRW